MSTSVTVMAAVPGFSFPPGAFVELAERLGVSKHNAPTLEAIAHDANFVYRATRWSHAEHDGPDSLDELAKMAGDTLALLRDRSTRERLAVQLNRDGVE